MWTIVGILTAMVAIAMIEVPSLVRKKWKKELWVFSCLLLFGTGLSIALSLHANIPNPLDLIIYVYTPLSDAITSWLK